MKPTLRKDDMPTEDLDIEVLKMDKYGGLFNLAALTLAISLLHSAVISLIRTGFLLSLSDWTCPEFIRDLRLSSMILFASLICSFIIYFLIYLFSIRLITELVMRNFYSIILFLFCGISSFVLFINPIAPIVSILTILTVLVVALKLHSFVCSYNNDSLDTFQRSNQHQQRRSHSSSFSLSSLSSSKSSLSLKVIKFQKSFQLLSSVDLSATTTKTLTASPLLQIEPLVFSDNFLENAPSEKALTPRSAVAKELPKDGVRSRSRIFINNNNSSSSTKNGETRSESITSSSSLLQLSSPEMLSLGSHIHQPLSLTPDDTFEDHASSSSTTAENHLSSTRIVCMSSFLYFLAAPTLVFKKQGYTHTQSVNRIYVLQMLLEGLVEATLIYAAFKQFILPVLTESPPATHSHNQEKGGAERARRVVGLFLDVLRLSIPSMLVWLACFDLYFNRLLQAQAELLMYKERKFNGPFWNSTSLSSFWRTWNIPVHEWAFEHVFKSMRTQSVPREVAVLFTFLLSAMLHEVIFSVAFKTIRPYFFIGMLLQVPLVLFTHSLKGTRRGNLIVWLSLFCGHPLLEILYLREYLKNHDMFCVK